MQVTISEFEAKCIELLEHVHVSGEDIIVTMSGKPFVRVIGIVETIFGKSQRVLGGQDGVMKLINGVR